MKIEDIDIDKRWKWVIVIIILLLIIFLSLLMQPALLCWLFPADSQNAKIPAWVSNSNNGSLILPFWLETISPSDNVDITDNEVPTIPSPYQADFLDSTISDNCSWGH